jgi:hypothetical protein
MLIKTPYDYLAENRDELIKPRMELKFDTIIIKTKRSNRNILSLIRSGTYDL